jgi:hypothetical protein
MNIILSKYLLPWESHKWIHSGDWSIALHESVKLPQREVLATHDADMAAAELLAAPVPVLRLFQIK